jgi:hypothetical protein|nr:MAG TPA: hypothetical protein [Caudoviricetes sp.]
MTSFDKIEELALSIVDDYKLMKLINTNYENFQSFCDGLLFNAVPQFTECRQSLNYDDKRREFEAELTNLEIYILSRYWVIAWWERENNNAAQIALKLGIKNQYSYNSESQNFKEKQNVIDKLREEVDRATQEYLLLDLDSYGL